MKRTTTLRRLAGTGSVALLLSLFTTPTLAQSPAEEAVALRYRLLYQQVRRQIAEAEASGGGPGGVAKLGLRANPKELLAVTAQALEAAYDAADKVDPPSPRADADPVRKRWEQSALRRAEFQHRVTQAEAAHGFSWTKRGPPLFRPTIWDGLVLAWAFLAYVLSIRRANHELRLVHRRARRAGLIAAALAILVSGCFWRPEPEPSSIGSQLQQTTADADAAIVAADKRAAESVAEWASFLHHEQHPEAAELIRKRELALVKKTREAAIVAAVRERLASETKDESDRLAADSVELAKLIDSARLGNGLYLGLRVVAVLGLAAVTVIPLRRARRIRAAQRRADMQTCPRCGKTGQLTVQKETNPDPHAKTPRRVVCGVCGNEFPETYRDEPRLCFPTVGISGSGKTHMLATGYHQLRLGKSLSRATLLPLPFHRDELFDKIIEEVLRHRRDAGATIHGKGADLKTLPNPVLLHVTDIDPRGPSGVLVNLFDYSGEMVEKRIDSDVLRQRAVLTDGFLLFIDPTQLHGVARGTYSRGVQLEDQMNAFTRFYHDCVQARGLTPGAPIPVPVAVCVTKFDLLPTENPAKGTVLPYIQHLVTTLAPPGDVKLATLQARSELVRQLLPVLLPGAGEGLTRQLHAQFGTRVMYFPMSSVNLNVHELMNPNATNRSLAPFGVVEPILWLLHMYGYCVFPDARRD